LEENLFFESINEWHNWLVENHTNSKGIWLIFYKKLSGIKSLTYHDAVEEALCFGWIDSKLQSIDKFKFRQRFTPRKASSVWSLVNKNKAEALIADGRMTLAGLKMIEIAKKNGKWDEAYTSRQDPEKVNAAFLKALELHPDAKQNFTNLSNSHKLQYLNWINSAKKEDTRIKRIEKALEMLKKI